MSIGHHIGWWSAPSAWALNTQLGQTLPHADCVTRHSWSGAACFITVAVSIGAALWSAQTARDQLATGRFAALSGSAISAIVGFAALLQGVATVVIEPCLR